MEKEINLVHNKVRLVDLIENQNMVVQKLSYKILEVLIYVVNIFNNMCKGENYEGAIKVNQGHYYYQAEVTLVVGNEDRRIEVYDMNFKRKIARGNLLVHLLLRMQNPM